LGSCVWKQLQGEALAALGRSYSELFSIITFGEQLRGATLGSRSNFARQLRIKALKNRRVAFGSNFAEQLSGTASENNFEALLWGIGLKRSSFGATIL